MIDIYVEDEIMRFYNQLDKTSIDKLNDYIMLVKEFGYEFNSTNYSYKRSYFCGNTNALTIVVSEQESMGN